MLLVSYVLQQRYSPFVAVRSISDHLQLTSADVKAQLDRKAKDVTASSPYGVGSRNTTSLDFPPPCSRAILYSSNRVANKPPYSPRRSTSLLRLRHSAKKRSLLDQAASSDNGAAAGTVNAPAAGGDATGGDTGITVAVSTSQSSFGSGGSSGGGDTLLPSTTRRRRSVLGVISVMLFAIDYNHLETAFLVAAVTILMCVAYSLI